MRWVSAARQSTKGVSMMEQIQTSADRLMDFVERVLVEKRGYVVLVNFLAHFNFIRAEIQILFLYRRISLQYTRTFYFTYLYDLEHNPSNPLADFSGNK
jgi:hypothetical protein